MGHDPRAQRPPRIAGHAAGAGAEVAVDGVDGNDHDRVERPVGTSFTRNLTPDKETGLGDWTVEEFIATMKTGRERGKGRPVLPPMPAQNLATLTDSDIRALSAYLQSLPPIRNRIPQPVEPTDQK